MPCCAFDDCRDDATEQTANHEKEEKGCGNCSPFFSCEGCVAAVVIYHPLRLEFGHFIQKTVYTVYIESPLPQADQDFWQPPRLS